MAPSTKLDVTLRPVRREELPKLSRALVEVSEAQLNNRWREQELGLRELLVAVVDGALVGTVSIGETERPRKALHLFALEVTPDLRDRGIGGAIVLWVVEEARRRGLSSVYLEVRVDNPARRLYHRLGFRRVGGDFVNAWVQFKDGEPAERVEELSLRMVKRVR